MPPRAGATASRGRATSRPGTSCPRGAASSCVARCGVWVERVIATLVHLLVQVHPLDEAIVEARAGLAAHPQSSLAHLTAMLALLAAGRADESLHHAEEALQRGCVRKPTCWRGS